MRPPLAVTLAAISALTLAGCSPARPPASPVPSPSPTYWCTPEAGGTSYRCTQAQFEQMQAQDELYAEAEAVYRRYFAEDERIYRAGGVDQPTEVLNETTTGNYLSDSMSIYRKLKSTGTKLVGGSYRIAWIKRGVGQVHDASVVALKVCVDGTTAQLIANGRKPIQGTAGTEFVYFVRSDQGLKADDADSEALKKC